MGGLRKICHDGGLHKAMEAVDYMTKQGIWVSIDTWTFLLQWCITKNELFVGRKLHSMIEKSEYQSDPRLGCLLIRMFASCGSMPEAVQAFDSLQQKDVSSWTAIISAHARYGQSDQIIKLYCQMQISAVKPSAHTFVLVVKACAGKATLLQGKLIHADIIKLGLEKHQYIGSSLVDMYAKSGSLQDGRKVFDTLPIRDVVLCSAMIAGYAEHGCGWEALQLFEEMRQKGLEANKITFVCLLKACASVAALDQGKRIHTHIIKQGLSLDVFVGSALVYMYAKCGSLEYARLVFDKLTVLNVVSWSTIIAAYADDGCGEEALQLFGKMQEEGIDPDEVSYVSILKACASIAALGQGKAIHLEIMKRGFGSELFVGSALIDMYGKCDSLKDARQVFDKLPVRNVVSWSALIAGYADHGHGEEALQLFEKMIQEGKEPSKITFLCILKACSGLSALDQGELTHASIIAQGLESELTVQNALLDMYIKCGCLEDAGKIFQNFSIQDVVSWSAMIAGHAEHGDSEAALQLYEKMKLEGINPNEVTFLSILKVCSSISSLEKGKLVNVEIMRSGFELDVFIGNALVDMYSKCGNPEDANRVFKTLLVRDVVSWNALIAGYADHGHSEEVLEFFKKMKQEGMEPNQVTFLCILKACSSIAALDYGKMIHAEIVERGLEEGLFIENSLGVMYVKCGSLEDAHKLFNRVPTGDVVSWNAMIAGYAEHGQFKMAQQCFEDMQLKGIKPDDVTFVCLLSGCSHSGLVFEAHHYFKSMLLEYGLVPTIEHYACMVDILGRAGCLNEAEDLISRMPFQPNSVVWTALLGSCTKPGNLEVGRRAFNCLLESDCRDTAGYVLMSNVYLANHMVHDAWKFQELRAEKYMKAILQ